MVDGATWSSASMRSSSYLLRVLAHRGLFINGLTQKAGQSNLS
jgi:hypothetical protein